MQNLFVETSRSPAEKWGPPLMEENWVVLCQALYQSIREEWNDTISTKIITEMLGADLIVFRSNENSNGCISMRFLKKFRINKNRNGNKFSRATFFFF